MEVAIREVVALKTCAQPCDTRRVFSGMFEGFEEFDLKLPAARIYGRVSGSGPPVLLLHGHPRTHATWHRVAPVLAAQFAVVCPDLRGFGRSSQPKALPDHANSSKRAKAADCVALMNALGFETFGLAGHDRGAYTAFRCAMDYPHAVKRLAILDGVPILEAFERATSRFALAWWHWFFFTTPDKPERAINADPIAWYAPDREAMGAANYDDMVAAIRRPAVVHGMVEDYRAGPAIDRLHDAADRAAGRRLACPTLVLWAEEDDLPDLYGDVLEVWRPWALHLTGHAFPSGHHMTEEEPERLASELASFFVCP
jgi:haloacetate dehalogenase